MGRIEVYAFENKQSVSLVFFLLKAHKCYDSVSLLDQHIIHLKWDIPGKMVKSAILPESLLPQKIPLFTLSFFRDIKGKGTIFG